MLGCAGSQLGANLSKRVIKSNSRIASLGFQNNDRDTWWSSRREGTQLFQGKHFQFGYLHHARLHEHASRHRLNTYITAVGRSAAVHLCQQSAAGVWPLAFSVVRRDGSALRQTATALISRTLPLSQHDKCVLALEMHSLLL
jgi:hypothetical protein